MRERNPEDFDLLYTEAEVNMRAERYDRAKALLHEYISVQEQRGSALPDKATTAGGDASDARLLLVQIAEKEGDRHEAIRQLDLIDDPGLRFQAQIHKAVLVSRSGDLEGARRTLQALTPQSDNERTVLALTTASIYRDSGRSDEAIAVLEQADAEMPDMAEIKYDLAMLYERSMLRRLRAAHARSSASHPTTPTPTTRWAIRLPIATSTCMKPKSCSSRRSNSSPTTRTSSTAWGGTCTAPAITPARSSICGAPGISCRPAKWPLILAKCCG